MPCQQAQCSKLLRAIVEIKYIIPLLIGSIFLISIPIINYTGILYYYSVQISSPQNPNPATIIPLINDTITMLLTISFGLFVIVGFTLKSAVDNNKPPKFFVYFLSVLFLMAEAISVNSGYMARSEMIVLARTNGTEFEYVQSMVGTQAAFTHLSFSIVVVIISHILLRLNQD